MEQTQQIEQHTKSAVQQWCKRIQDAKTHFESDFERMRRNMEFVAGLQWAGQTDLTGDSYVANLTLRTLTQKKSVLYAKNPKAEFVRRERLDFQLWDGKMETLMSAYQSAQVNPMDMQSLAVLNDYMQGMQRREVVDKIGETLKLLYEWNVDEQEPSFKAQMKDLVGRVLVCGVGYVKLSFVRDSLTPLTLNDKSTIEDRMKRIQAITAKMSEQGVNEDSPEVEELRVLLNSQPSAIDDPDDVQERLVFDFLPATSVIPDPACRSLRGFVGARWIAQEYVLPIREVNEYFEVNVESSPSIVTYNTKGEAQQIPQADRNVDDSLVCVWQVYDKRTQSTFFVCDGYEDYLQAPEPLEPAIKHIWPIFPLVFNAIETEPGLKVKIFPPSDVDLIYHAQKEWNRSRDALRTHRRANAPKYITSAELSVEDVEKIETAAPHSVVKLNSIPSGSDVSKLFVPIQHVQPNPVLYDTGPLQQDILQSAGMQEANLGPVSGNETATGQTIAEQSRVTAASSNVDDLDDFLSLLAQSGGEMLLRSVSEETAKKVCGAGAMLPMQYRAEFLNDVFLQIAAASSGRPNKAIDIANFERIAPFLLQAGANPQAIVREGVRRLDDSADIPAFFPLVPQAPAMGVPQPQQSLQALPSQTPVPLPGA